MKSREIVFSKLDTCKITADLLFYNSRSFMQVKYKALGQINTQLWNIFQQSFRQGVILSKQSLTHADTLLQQQRHVRTSSPPISFHSFDTPFFFSPPSTFPLSPLFLPGVSLSRLSGRVRVSVCEQYQSTQRCMRPHLLLSDLREHVSLNPIAAPSNNELMDC